MRLDPKVRKDTILAAAVNCAMSEGLNSLRRDIVATKAGASNGLVSRYFNTMTQLRQAVIRFAVHSGKDEHLSIVAEALVVKDPQALKAPEELKQRALASL